MRRLVAVWIFLCLVGLIGAVSFAPKGSKVDGAFSATGDGAAEGHSSGHVRLASSPETDPDRAAEPHDTRAKSSAGAPHATFTDDEIDLLAHAVHGEARGEPYTGQVAVAAVIINRVQDSRFPDSVAGVIFQPGAFTAVADKQIYLVPNETAFQAVRDAIRGVDPTGGAVFYYNPARATNDWIWSRKVVTVIGKHRFAH